MAKPMSAHNPFRTPNLTPMPTGASTASSSANPFNSPPPSPPAKNTPLAQQSPPHGSFAPEFEPIVERETDSPSPPASPAPPPPPHSPSPPPPEPVRPEITINNTGTGSTPQYAPPPGSPPRTHSPSPYLSQLDPPPPSGSRGPSSSSSHFAPPSGPPPSDTHSNLPPNLDGDGSGLDEELPPAYSAAPDPSIGETTVELGPRRPFQRAPELPGQGVGWQPQIQPRRTPQPQSHSQRLAHQPTGSLSSSGRIAPPSHPLRSDSNVPLALLNSASSSSAVGVGRSSNNNLAPPSLPARQRSHSAGAGSRPTRPPISPPEGELSEFAREFYAAGGRIPGSEPEVEGEGGGGGGDENAERRGRSGAGAAGEGGGQGADIGRSRTQYLPPPGEPPLPRRPTSAGGGRSGSGSGSTRGGGGAGGSGGGVADDGKPTRQPVPGHPLLNGGNILVYPAGYECRKCHNIGYKAADPSNPCRKCWDKFGKPFTNAMNYIPWSPARDAQAWSTNSSSGKSFQRPLPSSRGPHLSVSTSNLSSGGSSSPRPSASTSSTYLGSSTVSSIPVNENAHRRAISNPVSQHGSYTRTRPTQPLVQLPSSLSPPPLNRATSGALRPRLVAAGARPPPGAVVYQPGDPRLGGSLCWRCDGRGVTTFFIFDEGRCEACNGLGRIF